MNPVENATTFSAAASEYIVEHFEPTDRIAMLLFHLDFSEAIQRITSAQKAADPQFQLWLPYKNANGSDMDVTWNPTGVCSSPCRQLPSARA
jgi:hypothetical protein